MKRVVFESFLIFCLGVLAGCGGGGAPSSGAPSTAPPPPAGSTPMLVESNSLQSVDQVVVHGNDSGEVVAAWTLAAGVVEREVWANIYRPGTGWLGERKLADAAVVTELQVVMDDSGNAVALWSKSGDGIWAAGYLTGAWGTTTQVSSDALTPRLVEDPSGASIAAAAWVDNARDVFMSRFLGGSGWTTPAGVPKGLAGEISPPDAYSPRIGADIGGNLYVTWWAGGGFRYNISVSESGWAANAATIGATLTRNATLQVGVSGNAVLAWQEVTGGVTRAVRTSSYGAGVWSTPVDVHAFSGLILNPIMALVDGSGQATLAWDEIPAGTTAAQIRSTRYSPTTGWDPAASDVPGSVEASDASRIEENSIGRTVAIWAEASGIYGSLWGSTSWSDRVLLVNENTDSPQVALTDSRAMVLWLQEDNGVRNIWFTEWSI